MEDLNYTLADMEPGEVGTIQEIKVGNKIAKRLMELGFLPGVQVRCLGMGIGGSPVRVEVNGSTAYALAAEEARGVSLS